MSHLNLSVDQVLSTTRAVRKRLDLTRPVERESIEECIRLAQQAPSGGNFQDTHFVVVTAPGQRAALAEVWRMGYREYVQAIDQASLAEGGRIWDSFRHLATHLHEVPILLVACRVTDIPRDQRTHFGWANLFVDSNMATWSFMLAARERGLGTCMTTLHLHHEAEAAAVLEIPYESVVQTALVPVAYTLGTDFRPVARKPLSEILHWERW